MRRFRVALLMLVVVAGACGDSSTAEVAESSTTTLPQLGDELLVNGGFEDGDEMPANWTIGDHADNQTLEWATGLDENRYIHFASPLSEEIWIEFVSEEFDLTPGDVLLLSVDARTEGLGLVFMSVNFNSAEQDGFQGRGPGSFTIVDSEWTTFTEQFEVVEDAVSGSLRFALALNDSMTDEPLIQADVDNVSLRVIQDG